MAVNDHKKQTKKIISELNSLTVKLWSWSPCPARFSSGCVLPFRLVFLQSCCVQVSSVGSLQYCKTYRYSLKHSSTMTWFSQYTTSTMVYFMCMLCGLYFILRVLHALCSSCRSQVSWAIKVEFICTHLFFWKSEFFLLRTVFKSVSFKIKTNTTEILSLTSQPNRWRYNPDPEDVLTNQKPQKKKSYCR